MYGEAFHIKFKDHGGDWKIVLSQKDYTGSVVKLSAGGNPLEFSLNNSGDEKHKTLKSFTVLMDIEVQYSGQLKSIFGSDALKTRCQIFLNNVLFFQGYVTPSEYTEPLLHPPYDLTLQAVCGIGLLQEINFVQDDGSFYSGKMNKVELLGEILKKIDNQLPLYVADEMYETRMVKTKSSLIQQYINLDTYVGDDGKPISCYDVLTDILLSYRFLQQEGKWHATQLSLLDGTPFKRHKYEFGNTITVHAPVWFDPVVDLFDNSASDYQGYVKGGQAESLIEGAKELTLVQKYNAVYNMIPAGDFTNDSWEKVVVGLYGAYVPKDGWSDSTQTLIGLMVGETRKPYLAHAKPSKYAKESVALKAMDGDTFVVQLKLSVFEFVGGTIGLPQWMAGTKGATKTVKICIKLNDWYLTTGGWKQSTSDVFIEKKITSSGIEDQYNLRILTDKIPEDGTMEVFIYSLGNPNYQAILIHQLRVYFTNPDETEAYDSNEITGVQNSQKAHVLDDLKCYTGDVPELSNFEAVWRGSITLANGAQTKNWKLSGNTGQFDYAELISRIVLGGYKRDLATLNSALEAPVNCNSIIRDPYTKSYYMPNGVKYNVSENEWSGEWIEVMSITIGGANFNQSQVSQSREGNYTKTSASNDFVVYQNGDAGTGKRIYELPVASSLDGLKIVADKSGLSEAMQLDLGILAKKSDLDVYARKDTVNTYDKNQTINADLYVNGNIIHRGSAYKADFERVEVQNNLMQLNVGEPGSQITGVIPGTTIPFSGIEINRGTGEAYYMGVVEDTKPLLKLGKKASLEAIATRADSITDGHAIQWDATNKKMIGVAAVLDSLKLGGVLAANYARTDIEETFEESVTFSSSAKFNKHVFFSPENTDDVLNLRRYGANHTLLNMMAPPQRSWGGAKEATLALVRGDNNEYFMDLYNMDYGDSDAGNYLDYGDAKMGLRLQKRGTGTYTPFHFEYSDGTNNYQAMTITPNGTASSNKSLVTVNRLVANFDGGKKFETVTDGTKTTGNSYISGNIQSTGAVATGFTGSGWIIKPTGEANFDSLTVRKTFNVYELNINKIRSGNGSYWFSDGAKIIEVTDINTSYWRFKFDEKTGNPFKPSDIIKCQVWTGTGIKNYTLRASSDSSLSTNVYQYFSKSSHTGDAPEAGDEIVRIGNKSNSSRQGSIYITSNDTNAPYIDVLDGVSSDSFAGKIKARLGKLNGITDSELGGAITGYGLYSENVFLKGKIVAKSGKIGGWIIASTQIHKSDLYFVAGERITCWNATDGYKWRLNNDGSGQLASGAISWTSTGVTTFSNTLKAHIVNATTVNAVDINASSIKAGTLSAARFEAGSITADKLASNVLTAQNINFDNASGTNMNIGGKLTTNNSAEVGKKTHHLLIDGYKIRAVNGAVDIGGDTTWISDIGDNPLAHFSNMDSYEAIKFYRRTHFTSELTVSSTVFCNKLDIGTNGIVSDGKVEVNGLVDADTIMEGNRYLSEKYAAKLHTHDYLPTSGGTLTGTLTIEGNLIVDKNISYNSYHYSGTTNASNPTSINTNNYTLFTIGTSSAGRRHFTLGSGTKNGQICILVNINDGEAAYIKNILDGGKSNWWKLGGGDTMLLVWIEKTVYNPTLSGGHWFVISHKINNW